MKKMILFMAAIMFSVIAFAQSVDFTGSWKLNNSKSKLNDQFTFAPGEIKIIQSPNELIVEKQVEFQGQQNSFTDKVTLDGKESINKGMMDIPKKSVAIWSADKKSLGITTKFTMGDGNEMTIIETYKMDSTNFVLESKASSSYGEVTESYVYDKK